MKHILLVAVACAAVFAAACGPSSILNVAEPTTTPEVYIPLDKAIPDKGLVLEGVHLDLAGTKLAGEFPVGCTGAAPGCTQAKAGTKILSVTLAPRDLPTGNMLAYKNLPAVRVAMEGGTSAPFSLTQYNNANQNLTLGFKVPAEAKVFGLQWAELAEIPLKVGAEE